MEPIKMTRAEYEKKYGPISTQSSVQSQNSNTQTPQATPVKMTRAQYEAKYNTPVAGTPEKGDGFIKSLVKAPLTMLARPVQAAAEIILPGDNTEMLDKFSKEKLGGFVAPVPQNFKDVKKDVGRGVQTVAFGMPGLASGGAAFGVGSSLEKGNDLLSKETATESVLSAAGSKIGGAILNPLFRGASKLIPQPVKDTVSGVFSKVKDKTSKIDLLPTEQSSMINTIANKTEDAINAPFNYIKSKIPVTSEGLLQKSLGNIGNTKTGKNFKQLNNGMSMEEYLVKSGNINAPEKTMINEFNKAKTSQKLSERAMKDVPGVYKNSYVDDALVDLAERERRIGIPGKDSKEIISLLNKNKTEGLTFSEANRVKQLYEKHVRPSYFQEKNSMGVERANRIDDGIREWQRATAEKGGYTNLAEMMKQTQSATMVANELYKKGLKTDAPAGFNLFDAVLLAGGNPTGLGLAFARRLFGSGPLKTTLARTLAPKPSITPKVTKQGPIKDLFLNAPKPGTPKTTQGPITQKLKGGPTLFTSPKGTTTPIKQEAVDIASVDTKKAVKPKPGKNLNRQVKIKEALEGNQPVIDPKKLPKIEMGTKPKIGDVYKGKPVIELGSSNPKVQSPDAPEKYIAEKDLPVIDFGKTKSKVNKQKGSALSNLITSAGVGTGVIAAGTKIADMFKKGKNTDQKTGSTPEVPATLVPKKDLREAFLHVENRGAKASGEDLYKVKGVTGDLGKYQVKPQTLKDWSKAWLDKQYTPDEFLNDPKAQEEFMNQFIAVVDAYELSPQDAAIVWHKGWGVLGDSRPREEKKKALIEHIEKQKKNPKVMEYVAKFEEGLNN